MQPHDLRSLREKLKLTQQELAQKLELSSTAIAMMERGERPIMRVTELAVEHLRCRLRRKK